jgi:hypothetical protein
MMFKEGDILKRRTDVPERWVMWANRCVSEKIDPSLPQKVINSSPSLGAQLNLMPQVWWQHQWFERVGPIIDKELDEYM